MMNSNPQLQADAEKYNVPVELLAEIGFAAVKAKQGAYCPYSKFRVGACLLAANNERITGSNIENASYPVGVCAERCAMAKAVADGHKKFQAVAVATDISPPASPCGMCRQFMNEFCDAGMPVFMYDKDGKYVVKTMGELLPMSFKPSDLPPPERKET